MSQEGVEREWEVLGDAKDEASSKKSSANILGGATASELVESFWRKARGKDEGGNTGLSCEDVIERSEAALSSTILGGREDGVEAAEAGEGGESECGGGHADEYRLFEPLRTRVESTLTAMFYGFGLEDSKTFSALSSSSTKLANTSSTVLSLGILNLFLSISLLKAYLKNQKLRVEVDKRGHLIYKLISKLYEAKISYNTVPMPQYQYRISLM